MTNKVSIIIPVYNVESYVGRTLDSVFGTSASTEAFEVIVVNDGTRDRSMEVVAQFAERPNIIIVEQENQGLSAARMKGLSMATGNYVWFIDGDDFIEENGVEKVLGLLAEKPGIDVLMFPLKWVYKDGTKDSLDFISDGDAVYNGKSVIRDLGLPVWASPRFVFRRALTDNKGLFFPKGLLHEDEYFGPVLMCLADRISVITSPVYNYVQRSGSIIASRTIRSAYDMVSQYKLLISFMEKALDPIDNQWFRQYCFGRLLTIYRHREDWFRVSEFKRFSREKGCFVWRQWLSLFPRASIKKKIGRLFYFYMPGLYDYLHKGERGVEHRP